MTRKVVLSFYARKKFIFNSGNWHGSVWFGRVSPHQNQILAPWEINDGHSAQNYCLLVYSALHLQQPHSASPFFCSDCGLRLFLSYARTILTLWQRWNFFGGWELTVHCTESCVSSSITFLAYHVGVSIKLDCFKMCAQHNLLVSSSLRTCVSKD